MPFLGLGIVRERRLVRRLVLDHHHAVGVEELDEALLLPLLHLGVDRLAPRQRRQHQHRREPAHRPPCAPRSHRWPCTPGAVHPRASHLEPSLSEDGALKKEKSAVQS